MALEFSTTSKATGSGVKCGIHGRDGAGKTSLIPTAPRPFIFDFEGKLSSISQANIPYARIRSWSDWLEAKQLLQDPSFLSSFDTLFVDSISKLGEISLHFWKSQNKDARKAYQEHRDWFSVALNTFLQLPQKHVCLLAWSMMADQPDSSKLYSPSLPGMAAEQALGYSLEEMFFLNIGSYADNTKLDGSGQPTKVEYRYLQTKQDIYTQARDNSRTLLAQESEGPSAPPNLDRIFKKIQAGVIIS